jgi:type II secretory pathway pseudopilin PulG
MKRRPAFTAFEIVIAMSVLAVVIVVTAQVSYQAMRERMRTDARKQALEIASNTLEAARAESWEALTPQWAAEQRLPQGWEESQPVGELKVRVEPEAGLQNVKRVTATVRWDIRDDIPPQEVALSTLIAARELTQPRNGS